MSKMFRRFFTRSRDVKKGFRNVWELRKHLADNPPESVLIQNYFTPF